MHLLYVLRSAGKTFTVVNANKNPDTVDNACHAAFYLTTVHKRLTMGNQATKKSDADFGKPDKRTEEPPQSPYSDNTW